MRPCLVGYETSLLVSHETMFLTRDDNRVGRNEFCYPILIPIKKIHLHPHT